MDPPDHPLLTGPQRELARAVARALEGAGCSFDTSLTVGEAEAWHAFSLRLPGSRDLEVAVHVAADTFGVTANAADLRLELAGFGDDADAWSRMALETLDRLLGSDLRIRVRRTLFGGSAGAIWIPAPQGGFWNGDLFAYLGFGREQVFADWWRP